MASPLGKRRIAKKVLSLAFIGALLSTGNVQAEKVLRVNMHSDLKIVDPIWTTAYMSRNYGYMVYDTLFAINTKGEVCLLYTSPSPRDKRQSRMPSSA